MKGTPWRLIPGSAWTVTGWKATECKVLEQYPAHSKKMFITCIKKKLHPNICMHPSNCILVSGNWQFPDVKRLFSPWPKRALALRQQLGASSYQPLGTLPMGRGTSQVFMSFQKGHLTKNLLRISECTLNTISLQVISLKYSAGYQVACIWGREPVPPNAATPVTVWLSWSASK